MATYSGGADQQRIDKLQNEVNQNQIDLDNIKKKLKNKKLSKKARAKLQASKRKIAKLIRKQKRMIALEAKRPVIQNLTASATGTVSKVKSAASQVVRTQDTGVSIDAMEKLFFDSIGSTEIINVARHDNINTKNPPYMPIADMMTVNLEYDPNKIVSMQKTSSNYFNNFTIDLDAYIPLIGTGPVGENIYVDETNGNLVINIKDLPANFSVEVQTMSFDELFDDTIYI